MEPERVPVPDGIWMLPKGLRWQIVLRIMRLLGAKNYSATQLATPPVPFPDIERRAIRR